MSAISGRKLKATVRGDQTGSLGRTLAAGAGQTGDEAWRDSLNLASKLLAFRDSLPPGQRVVLDDILQRAQMATQAGLSDVTGYDAESPTSSAGNDPLLPALVTLQHYFAPNPDVISRPEPV